MRFVALHIPLILGVKVHVTYSYIISLYHKNELTFT